MKKTVGDLLEEAGLTRYEKDGKIHFTTKTLEQIKKEEEEKKGILCPECKLYKHSFKTLSDGIKICNDCYNNLWDIQYVSATIMNTKLECPFCKDTFITSHTIGDCKCGAHYECYIDEMYYNSIFSKRIEDGKNNKGNME